MYPKRRWENDNKIAIDINVKVCGVVVLIHLDYEWLLIARSYIRGNKIFSLKQTDYYQQVSAFQKIICLIKILEVAYSYICSVG